MLTVLSCFTVAGNRGNAAQSRDGIVQQAAPHRGGWWPEKPHPKLMHLEAISTAHRRLVQVCKVRRPESRRQPSSGSQETCALPSKAGVPHIPIPNAATEPGEKTAGGSEGKKAAGGGRARRKRSCRLEAEARVRTSGILSWCWGLPKFLNGRHLSVSTCGSAPPDPELLARGHGWLRDMRLVATGLAAGATHVSYIPCCAPYLAATHVSRAGARIGRSGSGRSSLPRPRRGSAGGPLQPLQRRLAHAPELSTTLMRGSLGRSCCRKRRLQKSGWSGSRSCRRSDKRKKPKKWRNKR